MMEINDFIKRYGAKFVVEKLTESNRKELIVYMRGEPF